MNYNRQILIEEMVRQGLTEKRLADLCGLHPTTVGTCLKTGGRPDSFYAIAKALGFPVKRTKKATVRYGAGKTVFVYDLTPILIQV